MSKTDIKLTGNHVKIIREHFKESQKSFCKRLEVSQPVIARLESMGETPLKRGPMRTLIAQIAAANKISLPSE